MMMHQEQDNLYKNQTFYIRHSISDTYVQLTLKSMPVRLAASDGTQE
jgi:hypothetical protein